MLSELGKRSQRNKMNKNQQNGKQNKNVSAVLDLRSDAGGPRA